MRGFAHAPRAAARVLGNNRSCLSETDVRPIAGTGLFCRRQMPKHVAPGLIIHFSLERETIFDFQGSLCRWSRFDLVDEALQMRQFLPRILLKARMAPCEPNPKRPCRQWCRYQRSCSDADPTCRSGSRSVAWPRMSTGFGHRIASLAHNAESEPTVPKMVRRRMQRTSARTEVRLDTSVLRWQKLCRFFPRGKEGSHSNRTPLCRHR